MQESWAFYAACPLVGFLGMMSGGYWGVGCGWIVVPVMLILGFDAFSAVGIGLLQMVPSTLLTVAKQAPEIGWKKGGYGRSLALPIAAGAVMTSLLGKSVNTGIVKWCGSEKPITWLLIVMITFIAVQTLFSHTPKNAADVNIPHEKSFTAFLVGLGTGLFSSMLGLGGGIIIRPFLSGAFKVPEYYTSRIVRAMVLVTTVTGGTTYVLRNGGVDVTVLTVAAMVAVGGILGFPLGAKMHGIVFDAGYAEHIHKSFAVVAAALLVNTVLNLCGLRETSRIVMVAIAGGLGIYLAAFTLYAKARRRSV